MPLNRRHFIQSTVGAGALSVLPACQRSEGGTADQDPIDMEELNRAAAQPVLELEGLNSPVIIDSIQLLQDGSDTFLHVRSKDGAEGVSITNGRPYLHQILNDLIAPYFIGKDARQLEDHLFGVYRHRSNYKLLSLALWSPVCWVELALLDMLGRVANKSMSELLGGVRRREIPFYRASGHRDTTPEEEVEILQQMIDDTGAKAVKFRVGGRMSRNADAMPGRSENLIRLARKTLGDGIDLHADSNSSYDPPQAIKIGKVLEEVGALFFEEPCPFDHWEDTKVVTDALTIPVAGGEQESSQRRFRWAIHNRAVDIVQPDLMYYGGLIRSIRVSRMADLAGMPTTAHISGGFGFIYMLHFAACIKDPGSYQEYKSGVRRYGSWFDPELRYKDGTTTVPEGPGVGIVSPKDVIKNAKPVMAAVRKPQTRANA